MQKIEKIIIRFPNWIGDIIMALPLIDALKKQYPKASVHAMIRAPFFHLLKTDNRIDKIIEFDLPKSLWKKIYQKDLKTIIKNESYDLAIICTRSISSAMVFFNTNIPLKIGAARFLGSLLLNHRIAFDTSLHQRSQYLQLLKPLNINYPTTETKLCVPALSTISSFSFDQNLPYIILHPGASYGSAKTWPMKYYETLAEMLTQLKNYQILFLGDKNQKKPNIVSANIFDLTGLTTLNELSGLIHKASLVICNDSGPMHMADGFNIPLITLFGPTDPEKTGPKSANASVIFNKVSCGPCFKRICPLDHACMKGIHPEQVFEKAKQILGVYGAS